MHKLLTSMERPVVILANGVHPLENRPREGYQQRVAAVDAFLGDRSRIYLKVNGRRLGQEAVRQLGQGCLEIEIGSTWSDGVKEVMRRATGLYSHSIYPLLDSNVRRLISERQGPLIVDLHGVVPEEIAFIESTEKSLVFGNLESWATLEASALVHVTRQMSRHFRDKYPWAVARHIICPIFPCADRSSQVNRPRNGIIYAGGTQPWQQVDEIVAAVAKGLPRYRATILTPEPGIFIEKFRLRGIVPDGDMLSIRAARPDEVRVEYNQHQFGILSRADHVINRVACPTKLVEYLHHGLIPVMNTPAVGDFADLGMQYASMGDIASHTLPSLEECERMAVVNQRIPDQLAASAEIGREEIRTLLN